jgi:hypothetical protein
MHMAVIFVREVEIFYHVTSDGAIFQRVELAVG